MPVTNLLRDTSTGIEMGSSELTFAGSRTVKCCTWMPSMVLVS